MPDIPDVTPDSVKRAQEACARERAEAAKQIGHAITDDGVLIGLKMANFVAAAIYGARGERRN